jgi:hypothetical protein
LEDYRSSAMRFLATAVKTSKNLNFQRVNQLLMLVLRLASAGSSSRVKDMDSI